MAAVALDLAVPDARITGGRPKASLRPDHMAKGEGLASFAVGALGRCQGGSTGGVADSPL